MTLGVAYLINQAVLLSDAAAPSTFGFTLELLWLACTSAGVLCVVLQGVVQPS